MSEERAKGTLEVNYAYPTVVMAKDKEDIYHDVCECENEANATFIVTAWNSHDRLASTLKEIASGSSGLLGCVSIAREALSGMEEVDG